MRGKVQDLPFKRKWFFKNELPAFTLTIEPRQTKKSTRKFQEQTILERH